MPMAKKLNPVCVQTQAAFYGFIYRFHFKPPNFVFVVERLNEIELTFDAADNTLGLQMLTRAFPGAHGIKYKNPATGAQRALL